MVKPKIILGIETSCDETAAAVVQKQGNRITILSNVVASSAKLQAKYGGVIPEQAAREQLKSIIPVIKEAISYSQLTISQIDAIAVTEGPGLIGSLLVGVETAKVLATVWQKPLVPINHLLGHFYANWISHIGGVILPTFPCIGLLVSGGHTDLILMTDHGKYKYLGGTRDDAAGECFDKCARLLGLSYPGGPNLSKLAEKGNPKAYSLPRPMMENGNFSAKGGPAYGWDFSFSGLKTAVVNLLHTSGVSFLVPSVVEGDSPEVKSDLAASIEDAITDVLVEKTITAIRTHDVAQLIVAGGVAANKILNKKLRQKISELRSRGVVHIPPPSLCTDNAAYIATAALFNYHPVDPLKLQANPNLSLSD